MRATQAIIGAPVHGHVTLRLASLGAAVVLVAAAPAGGHRWTAIHNDAFGYSACYPADLFRPAGASLNVGGQDYVGRGGARLRISGLANQDGDSLAVTAEQTIPNSVGLKRMVTYKVVKPDWAVLSGRLADGRLFYQRMYASGRISPSSSSATRAAGPPPTIRSSAGWAGA